ncbi:MAG: hypothetical protein ABI072_00800 [Edaphobacter sp.]
MPPVQRTLQAEVSAGMGESVGFIARTVICEDAAGSDAKLAEPTNGSGQEVSRASLGLIGIHGGEVKARVVIGGDVQELGADALDTVAAIAGDSVRWPLDAAPSS